MNCLECNAPTMVIDSRLQPDGLSKTRRRACKFGHRFSTKEIPVEDIPTTETYWYEDAFNIAARLFAQMAARGSEEKAIALGRLFHGAGSIMERVQRAQKDGLN